MRSSIVLLSHHNPNPCIWALKHVQSPSAVHAPVMRSPRFTSVITHLNYLWFLFDRKGLPLRADFALFDNRSDKVGRKLEPLGKYPPCHFLCDGSALWTGLHVERKTVQQRLLLLCCLSSDNPSSRVTEFNPLGYNCWNTSSWYAFPCPSQVRCRHHLSLRSLEKKIGHVTCFSLLDS